MPAFDLSRFINEPSAALLCEAKMNDWIRIPNYRRLLLVVLREMLKLERRNII